MRSRGFAKWILGLALLLVTAACTASRPPTPTPPPASDGGAAEATPPPTPSPTPSPTATQKPSPTPTPNLTATEQAQQVAATATAQAQIIEARQAEKEHIAAIQQIFTHYHEMYPNGYPGGMDVTYLADSGEGKGPFAKALWKMVRRDFDYFFHNLASQGTPEATPYESLEQHLKALLQNNPDGRLILVFEGTNTVYCPTVGDMTTCRFYGAPARVAAIFKYREGFPDPYIVDVVGLDQGGEFLVENGHSWAPYDFAGGTLPTDFKLWNQRPAYWEERIYWYDGEKLIPLGGIAGDGTKEEFTNQEIQRVHVSGRIRILPPELDDQEAQQILGIIEHEE